MRDEGFGPERNKMIQVVMRVDEEKLPPHTREEFEEWVEYSVGHRACISVENPLHEFGMVAEVIRTTR